MRFHSLIHIKIWTLNEKASLKIWELTKGGQLFFPFDPMTEKERAMKKYKIFSMMPLEGVWLKLKPSFCSLEDTRSELEKCGFSFVDRLPFAYTLQDIQYLEEEHRPNSKL